MTTLLQNLKYLTYTLLGGAIVLLILLFITTPTSLQSYASGIPQITEPTVIKPAPILYEYVQITAGCSFALSPTCARAYSGPSEQYKQIKRLRKGMVLKIDLTITSLSKGDKWYRIVFDEWLRYPERVNGRWYVRAQDVHLFTELGTRELSSSTKTLQTNKYILVDRSSQKLYAYEGDTLILSQSISTGLFGTPTPRGSFTIYKKTPSRYMQGPLPGVSSNYFDLPGVPWNLYFTHGGAVIHGAYWHNGFGTRWSHGCVNLPIEKAEQLYHWAELGTPVYVRD